MYLVTGGGSTLRTPMGSLLLCFVTDEPKDDMEGLLTDLLLESTSGRAAPFWYGGGGVAFATCCLFNAAILAEREVN